MSAVRPQGMHTRGEIDRLNRAQVGIGTLIVFIAMVLVAAIAAGVLINTAGFLQGQSEETGEQSSEQVTDRVEVISETGVVSGSTISDIEMNVKKAPGSDDINVDEATIRWIGPDGSAELTSGDWSVSAVSGTTSVLTDDSDVFTLTLHVGMINDVNVGELSPGESVTLDITAASGGTTTVQLDVPKSLAGESAVRL